MIKNPATSFPLTELSEAQEIQARLIFDTWNNAERLNIKAPWGSGKTLLLIGCIAWFIGQDVDSRFLYISASNEMAAARVSTIRNYIEFDPDYKKVFPHVIPNKKNWGAESFSVERNIISPDATVTAFGIDKTGIGTRGHVVRDDACDRKDLTSEATREMRKGQTLSTWNSRIDKGCCSINIYTPWHTEDANAELEKTFPGRTLTVRVNDRLNGLDVSGLVDGHMSLPEWFGGREGQLARKQELGSREYQRGMQMRAIDTAELIFRESMMRRMDWKEFVKGPVTLYGGFDPAWGRRKSVSITKSGEPCDTAFILGLRSQSGHTLIVEDVQSTESPETMFDLAIDAWMKWRHMSPAISEGRFAFETAFAQGFLYDKLIQRCRERGVSIPFIEHKQHTNKMQRIEALLPFFERGEILFLPQIALIIEQALVFPFGKKVDGLDALEILLTTSRSGNILPSRTAEPAPSPTAGLRRRQF